MVIPRIVDLVVLLRGDVLVEEMDMGVREVRGKGSDIYGGYEGEGLVEGSIEEG